MNRRRRQRCRSFHEIESVALTLVLAAVMLWVLAAVLIFLLAPGH